MKTESLFIGLPEKDFWIIHRLINPNRIKNLKNIFT